MAVFDLYSPTGRRLLTASSFVTFFVLWQVLVMALGIRSIVLPTPVEIAREFATAPLWYLLQCWYTLVTTLAGFVLAVVIGVILSVLIVEVRVLESTIYAFIVALNSVPKVAIAPLFVIWLGSGPEPKIAIAFLIAVFAIIIDTVLGLKSVSPDMLDLASTLRGGRLDVLWRIRFPNALPSMFAGMKVAMSLALVGAIVGEFVASERGLGYVILAAQGTFDTPRVFAAIFVLAIAGIILFWGMTVLEQKALPWHASQRRHGV